MYIARNFGIECTDIIGIQVTSFCFSKEIKSDTKSIAYQPNHFKVKASCSVLFVSMF